MVAMARVASSDIQKAVALSSGRCVIGLESAHMPMTVAELIDWAQRDICAGDRRTCLPLLSIDWWTCKMRANTLSIRMVMVSGQYLHSIKALSLHSSPTHKIGIIVV